MSLRFDRKVVLVTGATGAVGSACVAAFVAEGAAVGAVDVASSRNSAAHLEVTADLRNGVEIDRAFEEVESALGPLDVLVHSAAVLRRRHILELTGDDIDAVFGINVRAALLLARRAAESMTARSLQNGVIVNIGSIAAQISDSASVAYDASKGAVSALSRSLAVALGPMGIRVVEVAPGPMAKPQEGEARAPSDLDSYARRRIPLGRWALPTDVASAVLFAASADASYLTGTTIGVDGGNRAAW